MTMQMLKEADDKQLITITPQWMKQKFDEMNQLLFNGMLPECKLSLFTTGKGSQGHTLGWFKTHKEYQVVQSSSVGQGLMAVLVGSIICLVKIQWSRVILPITRTQK